MDLNIVVAAALIFTYLTIERFFLLGWAARYRKSARGQQQFIYRVEKVDAAAQSKTEWKRWWLAQGIDTFLFTAVLETGLAPVGFDLELGTIGALAIFHFVFFEFYFYWIHRLLHLPSMFWIHREHHRSMMAQPETSGRFSFLERLFLTSGFLAPFALAAWYTGAPVPLLNVGIALLITDTFNVWGHMNVEFYPNSYIHTPARYLVSSPTTHGIHHARVRVNYGLNTPWFDLLFGTAAKDYAQAFMNAKSGRPFSRFLQSALEVAAKASIEQEQPAVSRGASHLPGIGSVSAEETASSTEKDQAKSRLAS